MNFLAHLHLASLANSSFLGNLMADFVRGTPEEQYSAPVAAGIRLHRRIDTLTDSHPLVREARQLFRGIPPLRADHAGCGLGSFSFPALVSV